MRITTKGTILPLLLALAVLALAAASTYQPTPVGAQSGGALKAPKVTATAAAACNPGNPRAYLVVSYTRVDGASSYQYRVKWGRSGKLGDWRAIPGDVQPGQPWAPSQRKIHYLKPGETYVVQVRGVDSNGTTGPHGVGRYTHVGENSAATPTDLTVAYKQDGGNVDYTKARLTWQGNEGSGGWFSVQQRAVDGKWKSSRWKQFSQLDGDEPPYFHDVSGLDPAKGYLFRVTGHTASCQPSAWSDAASLWPTLSSTAAVTVLEADGVWRRQAGDSPLSFKVTWKGDVKVRWSDWVGVVVRESGEGQPDKVQVVRWIVTAAGSDGKVRTKDTQTASPRAVGFNNFAMGDSYDMLVKGLDADGDQLGVAQMVTIRPVHISPPAPVSDLALKVGDDNLSVKANWTAAPAEPGVSGMPKRYVLYLTNLDTGRARMKWLNLVNRGSKGQVLKTDTTFAGLWPGDNYRVSVQTLTNDSRSSDNRKGGPFQYDSWLRSEWVSGTITMPAGDNPDYAKVTPTLVWLPVPAGTKAPPYVIGDPTAYIVTDHSAPGGRARFNAPDECKDHTNNDHEIFFTNGDEDAMKARRKAQGQERILNLERSELARAQAEKQQYLDDTPEAERDRGKIAVFDQRISRHERNIEAGLNILAGLVAKLGTECARAYPAVESLTEADLRWYQTAADREHDSTDP